MTGKGEMIFFFFRVLQKDKKKLFKSMEKTWAAPQGDLACVGGCSIAGVYCDSG